MLHHEKNATRLALAPIWFRIGAFMIDLVLFIFFLLLPYLIFRFSRMETEGFGSAFPFLILLAAFFVFLLKDIVRGQSLGKFMLGIAVRDKADPTQVPSIGKLMLRNVLTFAWLIEVIVLLSGKNKEKLGDILAKTEVYRISKKPKIVLIGLTGVLVMILFVATTVFGVFAMIYNHSSAHAARAYIETNPRIIELVGEIESFGVPSGGIETAGGHGRAEFTMRVRGSEGTVRVNIRLVREPLRDWEVIHFYYRH